MAFIAKTSSAGLIYSHVQQMLITTELPGYGPIIVTVSLL